MTRHSHAWMPLYRDPAAVTPTPETDAALRQLMVDHFLADYSAYQACECGAVALISRHALHRVRVCGREYWEGLREKARPWNERLEGLDAAGRFQEKLEK